MPGGDVLARAAVRATDERIVRVALTGSEIDIVRGYVDQLDARALKEAEDFFAQTLTAPDLEALLDAPFVEKSGEQGGKPFRETRFSNGDYAVFYGALEPQTATAEYAHTAPGYFPVEMGEKIEIRLHLLCCRFVGEVKDLRPYCQEFPELIADDNAYCRTIGVAARAEGLHGLLVRSTRWAEGTNVPVFSRSALSEPENVAKIRCVVNAVSQTAHCDIEPEISITHRH